MGLFKHTLVVSLTLLYLIVAISPVDINFDETLSTLRSGECLTVHSVPRQLILLALRMSKYGIFYQKLFPAFKSLSQLL